MTPKKHSLIRTNAGRLRWANWILPIRQRPPSIRSRLSLSPGGYEAAITFNPLGVKPETWTIQQHSRIQSRQANSPDATSQSGPK